MQYAVSNYNRVIALTQYLINAQLTDLWKKAGQKHIESIEHGGVALTDVVLDAPQVVIPSDYQTSIIYLLKIKEGFFRYFDDSQFRPSSVSTEGWIFAVSCDLEIQDATDAELQGLQISASAVRRLGVSLSNADLDKKFCKWTISMDEQLLSGITELIRNGAFPSILGYVTKGSSISLQTAPCIEYSTSEPVGTAMSGNAVLNCLLIKEGTADGMLSTGNWATFRGTDHGFQLVQGRLVLSNSRFFEWLIPRISIFNDLAHVWASDIQCGAWTDSSYEWKCKLRLSDMPGGVDSSYWIPKRVGPLEWLFQDSFVPRQNDESSGASIAISGSVVARNTSRVTVEKPTRIVIKGKSTVDIYTEVWRGARGWARSKADKVGREFTWTVYIDLIVVDGQLSTGMTVEKDYRNTNDQNDLNYLGSYRSYLDTNMPNMTDQFKVVGDGLAQDLQNLCKLYFPASGGLTYGYPVINENNDVMCEIEHKEAA